jgi:hypothetical protein
MISVSRSLAALVAAALALTLASSVAAAEDADSVSPEARVEFDKRIFNGAPAAKANTYACFVRRYDDDHLARHPDQKVSQMKLLVTSEWMAEEKQLVPNFRLGVRFRSKRGDYDSSGGCNHVRLEEANKEVHLGCGVDCDGGGISIAMGKDDNSTIVRLERVRIWQNNKPDEDAAGELAAGKDDAIFRLDRVSLEECKPLVHDRKELAKMRSVSNRK